MLLCFFGCSTKDWVAVGNEDKVANAFVGLICLIALSKLKSSEKNQGAEE